MESLVVAVVALFLVSRILTKAGYSGWWALVILVPIVNLVMLWTFALRQWPNLKSHS